VILPFRDTADADQVLPIVRAHLTSDRVLGYPTETVYGLGTGPRADAVATLVRLKGRAPGKPFLLLISGRQMAIEWGLVFNAAAEALAEAFWPGPLTLVLPGGEGRLPGTLRGPEGGVAVRYTGHTLLARLIAGLAEPLTSTSANRPGERPAPGAERLRASFSSAVDSGELLILDGGVLGNVPSSTVVDCTDTPTRLIREGALPRAELRRAVGRYAP